MTLSGLAGWFARHRKLVVFIVGAALGLAIERWGTSNEWVTLGIAAATGLGIYQAPNKAASPASPPRAPGG